jgi:hypothetical protein
MVAIPTYLYQAPPPHSNLHLHESTRRQGENLNNNSFLRVVHHEEDHNVSDLAFPVRASRLVLLLYRCSVNTNYGVYPSEAPSVRGEVATRLEQGILEGEVSLYL